MTKEQGGDHQKVRNSKVRKFTASPLSALSQIVHEKYPWLMPNHVSVLGVLGVGAAAVGAVLLERNKEKIFSKERRDLILLHIISTLCDAFDGALARFLQDQGIDLDSEVGQIVDAGSDRVQELILALARIAQAFDRDDVLGALLSLMSALTNGIPSILRAQAEEYGYEVPETGRNLLGAAGTRGGRFFTGTISTYVPGTSKLIDGLNTFANLYTSKQRYNIIQQHNIVPPTLSEETRELAKKRGKVMKGIWAVGAGAVTIYTGYRLLTRKKK